MSENRMIRERCGVRLRGAENRTVERAVGVTPRMTVHGIGERLRTVEISLFAAGEVVGRRAGQLVPHLRRAEAVECRVVHRQALVFLEHVSSAESRAVVSGASAETVERFVFVVLAEILFQGGCRVAIDTEGLQSLQGSWIMHALTPWET